MPSLFHMKGSLGKLLPDAQTLLTAAVSFSTSVPEMPALHESVGRSLFEEAAAHL